MQAFQSFRGCLAVLLTLILSSPPATAAIIGVDIENTTSPSTPTNWNAISLTGALANLTDETGAVTAVDFALVSPVGPEPEPISAGTIPIHNPSLAGVDDFGPSASSATFSSLLPSTPYRVWVFSVYDLLFGDAGFNATITGSGAPTVIPFSVTSAGFLYINGQLGSSAQTLEFYATTVTSSPAGDITIAMSPTSVTNSETPIAGFAIEAVPEPTTLTLLAATGLFLIRRHRVR